MVLVARDQHVSMRAQVLLLRRTSRWETSACNFTAIVDVTRYRRCQTRARNHQSVQVDRRAAVLSQKGVQEEVAIRRAADDLGLCVDANGPTARISVHGAKVTYHSTPPEGRVMYLISWEVR